MERQNTHLKCMKNGRVFLFSEVLSTRDDMIPCDAKGTIAQGHIGDAVATDATQVRRKTKYLGNPANGVLYTYTDILAERSDFISIDSESQWKQMQNQDDVSDSAPVLSRTERQVVVSGDAHTLPDVSAMEPKEAKRVLSEWAMTNHSEKIDLRQQLPAILEVCEVLAGNPMVYE